MKKSESKYTNNIFENIKHIDDYENEYWYARELSKVLEYKDWRNFLKVLNKAKETWRNKIGGIMSLKYINNIEYANEIERSDK